MIGSVTNECRHIFHPDVMSFGEIVRVFEKQEVHVAFSFAFGAAIFHREPKTKAKTLTDMEGLSFSKRGIRLFERENSTPRRLESVRNLCNLSNDVGYGWVDIAPTTHSKRSIFRHCLKH